MLKKMSKPILHEFSFSPPVRSVLLVAKAINLDLELRTVDMIRQEHHSPEFLKINPQHTVPTLDDNGHIIWDSHAIITYLVDKYAADDFLYSKDLAIRSQINQRLHFDSGILFPANKAAFHEIFVEKKAQFSKEKLHAISAAYELLNALFKDNKYLVKDHVTIADHSCITTVLNMSLIVPIDVEQYPKICAWIQRMEKITYFDEINRTPMEELKKFLQIALEQNSTK